MATCKVNVDLSDGTDKADLSVVHDLQNMELGNGSNDFADGVIGWEFSELNNEATILESGGKLSFSIASGVGTGALNEWTSNSDFVGDFDVEVDFSNFVDSNGAATASFIMRMQFGGTLFEIIRRGSSGTQEFVADASGAGASSFSSSTATGKLRLRRIDKTVLMYYDDNDGNGYKLLHSASNHNNANLQLKLRFVCNTTAHTNAVGINLDDLRVNINGVFDTSNPQPNAVDWNSYIIGSTVDMSTIDILEGGTGSSKYQYGKNNQALNGVWLSLAQLRLEADFTVTHANSFKVVTQFISDGTQTVIVGRCASVDSDIPTPACDYPAEADVRDGVDYDSSNLTGTAAIPGASDVRLGVDTDATVGTAAIPSASDTRLGVAVDATTGTAAIPGANDVRSPVPVDATTGNYVPAGIGVVLEGEQYGSLGTEFTGTLVPFKASYELPQEVILEGEEIVIFEGCD